MFLCYHMRVVARGHHIINNRYKSMSTISIFENCEFPSKRLMVKIRKTKERSENHDVYQIVISNNRGECLDSIESFASDIEKYAAMFYDTKFVIKY